MTRSYNDIKPIEILRNRVTQISEGITKREEHRERLDGEIRRLEIMRIAFEEAIGILVEGEVKCQESKK